MDPKPTIDRVEVTYSQEQDTCGITPDPNTITLESVMVDDGYYIVLKTDGWAIDSVEEITALVKDFQQRCKPWQQ